MLGPQMSKNLDHLVPIMLHCMGHNGIDFYSPPCEPRKPTWREYQEQMAQPDRTWFCPSCHTDAWVEDIEIQQPAKEDKNIMHLPWEETDWS